MITALYDGFVPVLADDLHGAPPAEIHRLLAEAFLPPEGDRCTAVNAFLVEENGRRILIDAGSGNSLGPDTGHLATNLAAAQTDPAEVDHVVLTHLHPDHAGGLLSPEGQPVFPRAAVHAAKADAPSGTALLTANRMAAASSEWTPDPTSSMVVEGARGGAGPAGRDKAPV